MSHEKRYFFEKEMNVRTTIMLPYVIKIQQVLESLLWYFCDPNFKKVANNIEIYYDHFALVEKRITLREKSHSASRL